MVRGSSFEEIGKVAETSIGPLTYCEDLNNDGLEDFVVRNSATTAKVIRFLPSGGLETKLIPSGNGLVLGDFDGDGFIDIYFYLGLLQTILFIR